MLENCLYLNGFSYVWDCQTVGDVNTFLQQFRERLKDVAFQNWYAKLSVSKYLSHYSNVKTLLNVERYVISLQDKSLRRALCKFRISLHNFNVQYLRKNSLDIQSSVCTYCCKGYVESEEHVFFICDRYQILRAHYMNQLNLLYNGYLSLPAILNCQNINVIKLTSVYLCKIFNFRKNVTQ